MEIWEARYSRWIEKVEDAELRAELSAMDAEAREDAFYRELEFGTGGLRGVLGAGSNRMNIHVVARATQGIANYLRAGAMPLSAAIGYDSRFGSRTFAETTAGVFAANGIKVYMYPSLMPTPALSFAVRHFGCGVGVMITASHNPAAYNGYKVYGSDGCQITTDAAEAIQRAILELDEFEDVKYTPFSPGGLISAIGEDTREAYLAAVDTQSLFQGGARDVPIVYTPLNGAGIACVPDCLRRHGFSHVMIPPEQGVPDGRFPTCPYPNPEIREALSVGLRCAAEHAAELLLATDPDCDRVGAAVRTETGYELLNGNQMGVLLLDFVCRMRRTAGTMPARPLAVKTIVTTPMAEPVAEHYGVEIANTLTGFKYIGERIGQLEQRGEAQRFLFGFEESYGYLSLAAVRDKDAVNASLLIAEMFLWYREQGMTLIDALEALYGEYGWYRERLLTFSFPGSAGLRTMQERMAALRREPPAEVAGLSVEGMTDYQTDDTGLPAADVLQLRLQGGSLATVRPSGTEPKLKVYLAVRGESREAADAQLDGLAQHFSRWVGAEE